VFGAPFRVTLGDNSGVILGLFQSPLLVPWLALPALVALATLFLARPLREARARRSRRRVERPEGPISGRGPLAGGSMQEDGSITRRAMLKGALAVAASASLASCLPRARGKERAGGGQEPKQPPTSY
jgi:hypothetical protein